MFKIHNFSFQSTKMLFISWLLEAVYNRNCKSPHFQVHWTAGFTEVILCFEPLPENKITKPSIAGRHKDHVKNIFWGRGKKFFLIYNHYTNIYSEVNIGLNPPWILFIFFLKVMLNSTYITTSTGKHEIKINKWTGVTTEMVILQKVEN